MARVYGYVIIDTYSNIDAGLANLSDTKRGHDKAFWYTTKN